jgi:histidine ammonia-lyase
MASRTRPAAPDPGDTVVLDGTRLTCDQVSAVARDRTRIEVSPGGADRARAAWEVVREVVRRRPVYGRTTGVGANRTVEAGADIAGDPAHGLRLLRSHAGGAGPPLGPETVRAMLVVRLNQLAAGGSGVHPGVLDVLATAVNRGVTPPVRSYGAIGTADLTALASTALCILGERGWTVPAGTADDGGPAPFALSPADALAFISSNAATVGEAALACHDLRQLLHASLIIAALSFLAVDGSPEPYAAVVHDSRPHPGQWTVAARMRELLAPEGDRAGARIQDPFSYRALPQVHGPAVDALGDLDRVLTIEMNAAAENPLVDTAGRDVLHNGNFHTAYVALALDAARAALFGTAALSAARLGTLFEPAYTGLGPFLADGPEASSGLMILEYVAHSALGDMRQHAVSAALGTAVLSRGVEEHASFSAQAAHGATELLTAYPVVLACELVAAVRVLRMKGRAPSPGPLRDAYDLAAQALDPATEDRPLDGDVAAAAALLTRLDFA